LSKKKQAAAPREQTVLEFPKNALLPALAGAHQKNLVRLEQSLGVRLAQRGNLISVEGDATARTRAGVILRGLYERLERGESIGKDELETEIRFASHADTPKVRGAVLRTAANRVLRPRTPAQESYLEMMQNHSLVFAIGPAGTGKTYLAAAMAAHMLYEKRVDRIILTRPALEAGERLGFLPGDLKEKVDPYLRPLYDALFDTMGEQYEKLLGTKIEIAPLAFMRGRTLARAFVILDEAQNTSSAQMKMFLTRLGEDSHMVVAGDPTQSDLPGGQGAGLSEALSILDGVEGVGIARFGEQDVVRHTLVTRIVTAYNRADAAKQKP
jgi:phosphate starvation-inducible PhoH-like protein